MGMASWGVGPIGILRLAGAIVRVNFTWWYQGFPDMGSMGTQHACHR